MMKKESSKESKSLSTELSSETYNIDNVVKDLNALDPDGKDIGWEGIDAFDHELIGWVNDQFFEQTEFQNRYFVVNSQVTPYRQVRQACMEVQARTDALQRVTISYKRSLNDIKRIKAEYEAEEDPFWRQDKEYELELLYLDLSNWKKKINQCKAELEGILKIIKEKVNGEPVETLTEYLSDRNIMDEEEHKYWIARLGKQASMDLLTTGRIQAGNLDSILMLSPEDQAAVTELSLTYSTAMNKSVGAFKEAAEAKVEKMLEGQPAQMFDTAGVLSDYASSNLAERKQRSLQSSSESETSTRTNPRITDSLSKEA